MRAIVLQARPGFLGSWVKILKIFKIFGIFEKYFVYLEKMPLMSSRGGRLRSKGKPRVLRRRRFVRKNVQRTTNVNRSLQPIPSRYICKMKYAANVVTNVDSQYVFNLNSLFDPERTGGGHQPYGYDPLAGLYNRYRVIACSWRAHIPTGATGTPVTLVALPSNDVNRLFADVSIIQENPRAKYIVQNSGAKCEHLTGKSYLPSLMGRTTAQYMADDNYQAIVTSSPAELGLLYIASFNAINGLAVPAVGVNIILEYTVEFFDVKHVVQS